MFMERIYALYLYHEFSSEYRQAYLVLLNSVLFDLEQYILCPANSVSICPFFPFSCDRSHRWDWESLCGRGKIPRKLEIFRLLT